MADKESAGSEQPAPIPQPPAPKPPKVKAGDEVRLVAARGEHLPAKVLRVHPSGKLDVEFQLGDDTFEIHASPFDADGKLPDSWHVAK